MQLIIPGYNYKWEQVYVAINVYGTLRAVYTYVSLLTLFQGLSDCLLVDHLIKHRGGKFS